MTNTSPIDTISWKYIGTDRPPKFFQLLNLFRGKLIMFKPSDRLIELVIETVKETAVIQSIQLPEISDLQVTAISAIQEATIGLFGSMARSLQDTGRSSTFRIGDSQKFDRIIRNAILFRIHISACRSDEFMKLLYQEIHLAVLNNDLHESFWKVCIGENDSLVLVADKEPVKSDSFPKRVRAMVVDLGM
jgi:hypothetical protein